MAAPEQTTLTDRDRAILDFEAKWSRNDGHKEAAAMNTFGMKFARYHQILNRLLTNPDAIAYNPMLVKRLVRQRDERTTVRAKRLPTKSPARIN